MRYSGAPEFSFHLHPDETRKHIIVDLFERTQAFEIPVVSREAVLGVVSLFDVVNYPSDSVNLMEILKTDIYVAGRAPGTFSFAESGQSILPFVDQDGKYITFINRETVKCYLPSKEYIQMLDAESSGENSDANSIDVLFENSESCHFITTSPGQTIQYSPDAILMHNVTNIQKMEIDLEDICLFTTGYSSSVELHAGALSKRQPRKELTLYRVGKDERDNLLELRQGITKAKALTRKYKSKLSNIEGEAIDSNELSLHSGSSKQLYKTVKSIARFDSTVLLLGESGVGKSMFASIIHENSPRSKEAFITVDCASLPESLLESELFGYESGSFTGAKGQGRIGLVETANKGTLFLDEISELPLNLQGKLLRLIQDKCFYRVGGTEPIYADVRIIAATNRDIQKMVEEKLFRKDLYFRINVVPVSIPPLRERKDELATLINIFVRRLNTKYGMEKSLHPYTYQSLMNYEWPGNIRELQNVLEYMFVTSIQDTIYPDAFLHAQGQSSADESDSMSADFEFLPLREVNERFEKAYLENAIKQCKTTTELADKIGVNRSTLTRKLLKYNLKL